MVQLELTQSEAAVLKEVLEYALSELRMEIADTDRKDFREQLKAQKEALTGILERLGAERQG
ncbi:hypothetical protein [Deferrisoma sp.]